MCGHQQVFIDWLAAVTRKAQLETEAIGLQLRGRAGQRLAEQLREANSEVLGKRDAMNCHHRRSVGLCAETDPGACPQRLAVDLAIQRSV